VKKKPLDLNLSRGRISLSFGTVAGPVLWIGETNELFKSRR
jgi:hypothetical protein